MERQEATGKELESWKEIAAYLGTSVRTVQRWEEQNGLPVRRVMREKRAAIYANSRELDEWVASRTTVGAKGPAEEMTPPGQGRNWWGWVGVVSLLGMGLVGAGMYWRGGSAPRLVAERVTSEHGLETQPAASPDGQWVAYVSRVDGRSAIRVRGLAGQGERVLAEGEAQFASPQWSRDGGRLAFLRAELNGKNAVLVYDWKRESGPTRVAEVMGRGWYELGAHSFPAVQWPLRGDSVLVVDNDLPGGRHRIVKVDLQSGQRGQMLVAPEGVTLHGFAVAPDEKRVAVVLHQKPHYVVHVGELDEQLQLRGRLEPVVAEEYSTESPSWLPNGDLLFLTEQKQIWRMKRGGKPERVDLQGEWPEYTLSGGYGNRVFWSHLRMDAAIWLYDAKRDEPLRRLCDSTMVDRRPRLSPDGREMLFTSERSGRLQVWACDWQTGKVRAISDTESGMAVDAEWAPDGERIVYTVNWGKRGEVRLAKRGGQDVGALASGAGEWTNPMWNAAGDRVHYQVEEGGRVEVRSVSWLGGESRLEGRLEGRRSLLLRKDGRYWVGGQGKVALHNERLEREKVVLEGVDGLTELLEDRLGMVYTRRVSTGMAGSYELYEWREGTGERKLAKAAKEGMGFGRGPGGQYLLVQASEPKADVFVGGPLN